MPCCSVLTVCIHPPVHTLQDISAELQAQLGARDAIIQGLMHDKGLIEEQNQVSLRAASSHSITNLLQPSAFCPLSPVCALLRNTHFLLSLAGPDAPER